MARVPSGRGGRGRMTWLTLCLVMIALPVFALVYQRVADSGMA